MLRTSISWWKARLFSSVGRASFKMCRYTRGRVTCNSRVTGRIAIPLRVSGFASMQWVMCGSPAVDRIIPKVWITGLQLRGRQWLLRLCVSDCSQLEPRCLSTVSTLVILVEHRTLWSGFWTAWSWHFSKMNQVFHFSVGCWFKVGVSILSFVGNLSIQVMTNVMVRYVLVHGLKTDDFSFEFFLEFIVLEDLWFVA